MKTLGLVGLCIVVAACSPTAPGGYDPNKPIDRNNVPPGPGLSVVATFSYGLREGNCPSDFSLCGPEVTTFTVVDIPPVNGRVGRPERTYTLKPKTEYTFWSRVDHPAISGRMIAFQLSVSGPDVVSAPQGTFVTQMLNQSVAPNPMLAGISFRTRNGVSPQEGFGNWGGDEWNQDLALTPQEFKADFIFRTVR